MAPAVVEGQADLCRIGSSNAHLAVVKGERSLRREVHPERSSSRVDDAESHGRVLATDAEVDGLYVLVLVDGIDVRGIHVDVESGHRVDLHIAAGTEAETVFAGFSIVDGERLEHRVELRGEVGYLDPFVFAVDGAFHHKRRVAAASHEGTEAAAVVFAFLSREHQHLATPDAQGRGHQVVVLVAAAAQQVGNIERGGSRPGTVVLIRG